MLAIVSRINRQACLGVMMLALALTSGCSLSFRSVGDNWDPKDDEVSGATRLAELTDGETHTHGPHSLGQGDHADCFRIWLSELGNYVFTASDGSGDTYGELFVKLDGYLVLVAENDDCGEGQMFYISTTIEQSGWYYLRVSLGSQAEQAQYSLRYRMTSRTLPDSWDPRDDTHVGATSLTDTGIHESHTLSYQDQTDWFRIYARSAGTYVFETHLSYGDTVLSLYNESMDFISQDDDGGIGLASCLTVELIQTGWYYVKIRPFGGRPTAYSFEWQKVDQMAPSDPDLDPWDASDATMSGATTLMSPVQVPSRHGPHVAVKDDLDWFRVYLVGDTQYRFEAVNVTGDPEGELYFVDSEGVRSRVASDLNSGSGTAFRMIYTANRSGWYYMLVYPRAGTLSEYTLEYSIYP